MINPIILQIFTLPSESSTNFTDGLDKLFIYVAGEVPIMIPLILFSFFMITLLGGFSSQVRREGKGDLPMWFSIAGYLTSILAMLMLLIDGLINLTTVLITLSITFAGVAWFFMSRNN